MERAVLETMNAGLRALEPHPLLRELATPQSLARFESHTLAFATGFGRLLERRVARNVDRNHPMLASLARFHLRLHQPMVRGLRGQLVGLGRAVAEVDSLAIGPRTERCLQRAEHAIDKGDALLVHALLVQGLECLTQLLARRGVEMAEALGGSLEVFDQRHNGHEDLLFLGIDTLGTSASDAEAQHLLDQLRALFSEAKNLLDEWWEAEPPHRPSSRDRRRPSRWGTGDLPTGVA